MVWVNGVVREQKTCRHEGRNLRGIAAYVWCVLSALIVQVGVAAIPVDFLPEALCSVKVIVRDSNAGDIHHRYY